MRQPGQAWAVVYSVAGQVDVTAVESQRFDGVQDVAGDRQLAALARHLAAERKPTHILTYGADPCFASALAQAKADGVQIIKITRGWGYGDQAHYTNIDRVLTTSPFTTAHYRTSIPPLFP